jgi:hypothetical protein
MQQRVQADVAVVGGGTAGAVAAIAAARTGARTVLIEQYGFVGGVASTGMVFPGVFDGEGVRAAGGLLQELFDRMNQLGGNIQHVPNPAGVSTTANDPELLKFVLMNMLLESGVQPVLHSFMVDTTTEGNAVRGVLIANKSGLQVQPAKVLVDATGDADVAARAGAAYEMGRNEDGRMQPITLIFRMDNVNFEEIYAYIRQHPEELRVTYTSQFSTGKPVEEYPADYYEKTPGCQLEIFGDLLNREWPDWPGKNMFHISTLGGRDEVTINVTRARGLDATNADDLSRAEVECQKQVLAMVQWLQQKAPGFRKARLMSVPFQVGVRETRRIKGLSTLTMQDVVNGKDFPDVIGRGAYPLDIHDPEEKIRVLGRQVSGHSITIIQIMRSYGIPYGCLVPESVDNLLVAGRCISATHEAAASARGMAVCMVTGEAAGTAAGTAARKGIRPRDLPIDELQTKLRGNKVVLDRASAERIAGLSHATS